MCEQNDYAAFGDQYQIEINSNDLLRVCQGSFLRACQEITFLSDNEIQFVLDTPISTNTWTAQLFTEDVPCTQWGFKAYFTEQFGGALLSDVSYEPFTATFEWPSSAEVWAGFANSYQEIYPLTFPNGGNITFMAATSGTDIDVYLRLEYEPHPNVDPAHDTSPITISGTDPKQYTIEISPQGANTYSSMIFYLMTRDQELTVSSDIEIITY